MSYVFETVYYWIIIGTRLFNLLVLSLLLMPSTCHILRAFAILPESFESFFFVSILKDCVYRVPGSALSFLTCKRWIHSEPSIHALQLPNLLSSWSVDTNLADAIFYSQLVIVCFLEIYSFLGSALKLKMPEKYYYDTSVGHMYLQIILISFLPQGGCKRRAKFMGL